jgi:hypothetical protein
VRDEAPRFADLVQLRELPAAILLITTLEGGSDDIGRAVERLLAAAAGTGVGPVGPVLARLPRWEPAAGEGVVHVELAVALTREVAAPEGFVVQARTSELAACLLAVGSASVQRLLATELRAWVVARGLLPRGPWEMAFLDGTGHEQCVELRILVESPAST